MSTPVHPAFSERSLFRRSCILWVVGSVIVATLVLFVGLGWFNVAYGAAHIHPDIVVLNNSDTPVVLDLGDAGPPAKTAPVPPRTSSRAFVGTNLKPGDDVRFWDAKQKRVIERRRLEEESSGVRFDGRTFYIEYPRSVSPNPP